MATFHEFRSALLGSAAYPASAHYRKCWLIHLLNITIVHASSTCTSNFRAVLIKTSGDGASLQGIVSWVRSMHFDACERLLNLAKYALLFWFSSSILPSD